jgi:hypothetical protein
MKQFSGLILKDIKRLIYTQRVKDNWGVKLMKHEMGQMDDDDLKPLDDEDKSDKDNRDHKEPREEKKKDPNSVERKDSNNSGKGGSSNGEVKKPENEAEEFDASDDENESGGEEPIELVQPMLALDSLLYIEEVFNKAIQNRQEILLYKKRNADESKAVSIMGREIFAGMTKAWNVVKWRITKLQGLLNRLGANNNTTPIGIGEIDENSKRVADVRRDMLIMILKTKYTDKVENEELYQLKKQLDEEEDNMYKVALMSRVTMMNDLNDEITGSLDIHVSNNNSQYVESDDDIIAIGSNSQANDESTASHSIWKNKESKEKAIKRGKGFLSIREEMDNAKTKETILEVWKKIIRENDHYDEVTSKWDMKDQTMITAQIRNQMVYHYTDSEIDENGRDTLQVSDDSDEEMKSVAAVYISTDEEVIQSESEEEEGEEDESSLSSEVEENPNGWINYVKSSNMLDVDDIEKFGKLGWNPDKDELYQIIHPTHRIKLNTVCRYIGGKVNKLNDEFKKDVYRFDKTIDDTKSNPIILYEYMYDQKKGYYDKSTAVFVERAGWIFALEIAYLLNGSNSEDNVHKKYWHTNWQKPLKHKCPHHNPREKGGIVTIRFRTNTELESSLNCCEDDENQCLIKYAFKREEDTPIYYLTHIPANAVNKNSYTPWLEYGPIQLKDWSRGNELKDKAIIGIKQINEYDMNWINSELEEQKYMVAGKLVMSKNVLQEEEIKSWLSEIESSNADPSMELEEKKGRKKPVNKREKKANLKKADEDDPMESPKKKGRQEKLNDEFIRNRGMSDDVDRRREIDSRKRTQKELVDQTRSEKLADQMEGLLLHPIHVIRTQEPGDVEFLPMESDEEIMAISQDEKINALMNSFMNWRVYTVAKDVLKAYQSKHKNMVINGSNLMEKINKLESVIVVNKSLNEVIQADKGSGEQLINTNDPHARNLLDKLKDLDEISIGSLRLAECLRRRNQMRDTREWSRTISSLRTKMKLDILCVTGIRNRLKKDFKEKIPTGTDIEYQLFYSSEEIAYRQIGGIAICYNSNRFSILRRVELRHGVIVVLNENGSSAVFGIAIMDLCEKKYKVMYGEEITNLIKYSNRINDPQEGQMDDYDKYYWDIQKLFIAYSFDNLEVYKEIIVKHAILPYISFLNKENGNTGDNIHQAFADVIQVNGNLQVWKEMVDWAPYCNSVAMITHVYLHKSRERKAKMALKVPQSEKQLKLRIRDMIVKGEDYRNVANAWSIIEWNLEYTVQKGRNQAIMAMREVCQQDEAFYEKEYRKKNNKDQSIIDLWGHDKFRNLWFRNYHYRSAFENIIIPDRIAYGGREIYISKVVKLQWALSCYSNLEYYEHLSKVQGDEILEDRNQIRVEEAISYLLKTISIDKKYNNSDVHGIILEDRRKITHPYMIEQLVLSEAVKEENKGGNYIVGMLEHRKYSNVDILVRNKIACNEAIEANGNGVNIVLDVYRALVEARWKEKRMPSVRENTIILSKEDIEGLETFLVKNHKGKYYIGPDYYWPNDEMPTLDFSNIKYWGEAKSQMAYIKAWFITEKISRKRELKISDRKGSIFKLGGITFRAKVMSKDESLRIVPINRWRLTLQANRNFEAVQAVLKYLISTQLKSCQKKKCKKASDFMGRYQTAYKKGHCKDSTIAKVLRWMYTNEKLERFDMYMSKMKEKEFKDIGNIMYVAWSYAIIKLDIKKAFDRVKWNSIRKILMKEIITTNTCREWVLTWSMIHDMYIGYWEIYAGKVNPNEQLDSYDEVWNEDNKIHPTYKDNGSNETVYITRRGVGQGTKLGPAIFNIVINSIINEDKVLCNMQKRGFIEIYGDDIYIQVLPNAKRIDQTIKLVQNCIEKVGLELNVDKTAIIYYKEIEGWDKYAHAHKANPVRVLGFNVWGMIHEWVELAEEELRRKLEQYRHVLHEENVDLIYKMEVFKESARLIGDKLRPMIRARVLSENQVSGFINRSLNILLGLKEETWVARIFGLLPLTVQRQLVKGIRNTNYNLLEDYKNYGQMDFIPGHTRSHLWRGSLIIPTLTFYWYKVDPYIIYDNNGIIHWTDILGLVSGDWSRGKRLKKLYHENSHANNKYLICRIWDKKEKGLIRFDRNHILEWGGTHEIRQAMPYTIEHMRNFAKWSEERKDKDILKLYIQVVWNAIEDLLKGYEENKNKYYRIWNLKGDQIQCGLNDETWLAPKFTSFEEARIALKERWRREHVNVRTYENNTGVNKYCSEEITYIFLNTLREGFTGWSRNDPTLLGRDGTYITTTGYVVDKPPPENVGENNWIFWAEKKNKKRVPELRKETRSEIKRSEGDMFDMYVTLVRRAAILINPYEMVKYDNCYDKQEPEKPDRRSTNWDKDLNKDVENIYYDIDELHKIWVSGKGTEEEVKLHKKATKIKGWKRWKQQGYNMEEVAINDAMQVLQDKNGNKLNIRHMYERDVLILDDIMGFNELALYAMKMYNHRKGNDEKTIERIRVHITEIASEIDNDKEENGRLKPYISLNPPIGKGAIFRNEAEVRSMASQIELMGKRSDNDKKDVVRRMGYPGLQIEQAVTKKTIGTNKAKK